MVSTPFFVPVCVDRIPDEQLFADAPARPGVERADVLCSCERGARSGIALLRSALAECTSDVVTMNSK